MNNAPSLAASLKLPTETKTKLESLPTDQQQILCAAFQRAQQAESEALTAALDKGLEFVPRLARGAVKKILFPK